MPKLTGAKLGFDRESELTAMRFLARCNRYFNRIQRGRRKSASQYKRRHPHMTKKTREPSHYQFPEAPPPGTVPACAEAGVMGALAGMLGSMMALEAIREIVGFGDSLVGRLVMVDARAMRFETLRYARDPANPLNGDTPVITDLSGHQ